MRFVALPHTEGCGVSETVISARLLLGHVRSPLTVRRDRPEIGPRSRTTLTSGGGGVPVALVSSLAAGWGRTECCDAHMTQNEVRPCLIVK